MRRLHLSLGLLFMLLGLTGSALVFYVGIDEAPYPVAQRGADARFRLDRTHVGSGVGDGALAGI